MNKLLFEAPINSLSLGNVSINFLKELFKKDMDLGIFPVGNQANYEAYDKIDPEFLNWINKNAIERLQKINKDSPVLKIWHINGAENRISPEQFLYTFYEVDSPTKEEVAIVKSQEHVFFSSSESAEFFKKAGCENVSYVPLGFDTDFRKTNKKYFGDDVIHFGLIGKVEKRKNTQPLIKLWLKLFGNNPKYQLTCLINNPFFKPEDYQAIINQTTGGQKWKNLNLLPSLKTNSEVNDLMNAIDIDLSGLSNGEGWNLPSFNATALGKWSIVSNCSSHKDWANKDNAILVDPVGKQPCYDNFFFSKGLPFNQGNYYALDQDMIVAAIEESVNKAKTPNLEGEKLQQEFTYQKSVNQILGRIF
jgi:hypothetical protein